MDQQSINSGTDDRRTAIRSDMRKRRASLSAESLTRAEQLLAKNIAALVEELPGSPRHAAGYLAINGEIPLGHSFDVLRGYDILTSVPVIVDDTMRFAPLTETTTLQKGKYGILIPEFIESELIDATSLDIVLVPLVAFDAKGNRLGMGGGYYDRTFAELNTGKSRSQKKQLFIGVGHEFQKSDTVPAEHWDVPLHMAVTDQHTYRF